MNNKLIVKTMAFVAALFLLFSCFDDEVKKEYVADVYSTVRIIDGDTLFGLESYFNANVPVKAVKMRTPGGGSDISMKQMTSNYFEYVLPESAYTSTAPATGEYIFDVTFDDNTQIVQIDNLTNKTITPMQIDSIVPHKQGDAVTVHWKRNPLADCYSIRVLNDNKIVLATQLLDTASTKGTLVSYSNLWRNGAYPKEGDSLLMLIEGVILEDNLTQYYKYQSISQSKKTLFVWPE